VGVVQTNMENDRALMASHAFDVILSGDDHSYATAYDGITAYVETSVDAQLLTPIDLMVEVGEKDGERTISWTPAFRFIDTATVTPDPETVAMADALKATMDTTLDQQIGTLEAGLDSRRNLVRAEEATMGNLIADALRMQTGSDIGLMNGGGIRGDRTYDTGATLTRRDILTELPFGNLTVVTELPGSQVLLALENAVSQVEKGAGRFAQVSGLTFAFDAAAEPGSRVSEVMVGGAALEADKLYTVAVNDYILGGGDGYAALGGGRIVTEMATGNLVATDVMNYVEKMGSVKVELDGRIKKLGG
jgi:2',3'-cyclic-nucleotide 2'-phosphodiesterase (5'-nucleotidase family)